MQVTKQRYWINPPSIQYGWRPINPYCLTYIGNNTGQQGWNDLEEYNLDDGIATGNTKLNVINQLEYVAPISNETTCPIPLEKAWRPINPYCVKTGVDNTGYYAYSTLEEYYVDTLQATGVTKSNAQEDANYIAPTYNITTCPLPIPPPVLAWRPTDPYCIKTITYYDLTLHRSGEDNKGDTYSVEEINGREPEAGVLLQRRSSTDVIRNDDVSNYTRFFNFNEDEIVASTVPYSDLRWLQFRYHKVKQLLINLSDKIPGLERLRMRGNWTELGTLDLLNCTKLNYLDTSICYLEDLILPPRSQDITNNFTYCYIGHYVDITGNHDRKISPNKHAIDTLMERAFYSSVATITPNSIEVKHFNTDACEASLIYNGINYHSELVKKGWKIGHISTEPEVNFDSSLADNKILKFLTTWHNWALLIPPDVTWLTSNEYSGPYVQPDENGNSVPIEVTLTAEPNNTGSSREAIIFLRKRKDFPRTTSNSNEHNDEFWFPATIKITQP